ncbi:transmembrane protein 230-like isoform X2 [Phoenix dactylifera]|nr:transmembrane protein 230-like isoform X2 [Phoenix dactylifera]XP_017700760.1 transmembrane protein 230-like isoform X2 [Phoenix dactylifera]
MASRRHVRYTPLSREDGDDDSGMVREEDLRFAYNPKALDRVPWKSIALALFLLALGSVLLFLSFFILTGHMGGDQSQAYGLMVLGILAFLPGFYETRIAYYSWRGAPGYRFASIPNK